jgi:hypothetical protein
MSSANKTPAVPNGTFLSLKAAKDAGMPKLTVASKAGPDIIDIRRVEVEINLKAEVLDMFSARNGPRKLPTLLLYDERGLQLFEDVRVPTPAATTPCPASRHANSVSDYILGRVLPDQ